jgi:hypothetical protein
MQLAEGSKSPERPHGRSDRLLGLGSQADRGSPGEGGVKRERVLEKATIPAGRSPSSRLSALYEDVAPPCVVLLVFDGRTLRCPLFSVAIGLWQQQRLSVNIPPRGQLLPIPVATMGRGKMDDAAAERIRKARGDKVRYAFPFVCSVYSHGPTQDDFARRASIAARQNKGGSEGNKGGGQKSGSSSGGKQGGSSSGSK